MRIFKKMYQFSGKIRIIYTKITHKNTYISKLRIYFGKNVHAKNTYSKKNAYLQKMYILGKNTYIKKIRIFYQGKNTNLAIFFKNTYNFFKYILNPYRDDAYYS